MLTGPPNLSCVLWLLSLTPQPARGDYRCLTAPPPTEAGCRSHTSPAGAHWSPAPAPGGLFGMPVYECRMQGAGVGSWGSSGGRVIVPEIISLGYPGDLAFSLLDRDGPCTFPWRTPRRWPWEGRRWQTRTEGAVYVCECEPRLCTVGGVRLCQVLMGLLLKAWGFLQL